MPGYSGYDVFQQLAANPSTQQTAVIFITSLDSPQEQQRCFEMGGANFINSLLTPSSFGRVSARNSPSAKKRVKQGLGHGDSYRRKRAATGHARINWRRSDRDRYVTYTNPVAEAMTGYPSKDAIGLSIERVMPLPQAQPVFHKRSSPVALDQRGEPLAWRSMQKCNHAMGVGCMSKTQQPHPRCRSHHYWCRYCLS